MEGGRMPTFDSVFWARQKNSMAHIYTQFYASWQTCHAVSKISRNSRLLLPSFTRNLMLVLCSVKTPRSILTMQKKNAFTNKGTEKYICNQ
jgi:hypothetical protein